MAYDDGYHSANDDDLESTEASIRSMPLYDEDGIEIPDDELPWNNVSEEGIPDDASIDWMLDDSEGSEESNQSARLGVDFPFADNRSASERRKRCVAWSCLHEQLRNFKRSSTGMIVRSRAKCAGSAVTRIFGAILRWNMTRFPRALFSLLT